MRLGVISDTHGLLRPEALEALGGSDRIIHAGDVGGPEILDALSKIAPMSVVRGNVDTASWALALPVTGLVEADHWRILVVHDRNDRTLDPVSAGVDMVVSGHSHQPVCETVNGVIYLNPGSAGPRRFNLPVTLALVDTDMTPWKIEFVDLTRQRSSHDAP